MSADAFATVLGPGRSSHRRTPSALPPGVSLSGVLLGGAPAPGTVLALAGKVAGAKTATAMAIACEHTAAGRRVTYLSFDEPADTMLGRERAQALRAGSTPGLVRVGDARTLQDVVAELAASDLVVVDCVSDLAALIHTPSPVDDSAVGAFARHQGQVCEALRTAARDSGCTLVLTCQLRTATNLVSGGVPYAVARGADLVVTLDADLHAGLVRAAFVKTPQDPPPAAAQLTLHTDGTVTP